MSDRNVAEFHSSAGRNKRILRFRKGNTPLGNGESKEELLRDARQFKQRKTSFNGEEIFFSQLLKLRSNCEDLSPI